MSVFVVGAKSSALARQYVQVLNNTVREGFSTGTIPQGRRTLTYATGAKKVETADTDYHGMFKLEVLTKEVESSENKESTQEYYLNIVWDDSNYEDQTIIGIFQNEQIRWVAEQKVAEDIDVYFDPFARVIVLAAKDDYIFSTWILIGHYSNTNHSVTQILKIESGTLNYSGYTGPFLLTATTNGAYVISGLRKLPNETESFCGYAYVNNTMHSVPKFSGALPQSDTYYYVRHTVAQTVESGDEDPDLSESEKQALRTQIINADVTISACTANITVFQNNIAGFNSQISTQTAQITIINNKYNNFINTANQTYQAEVNKVNSQIAALDPLDPNYTSEKQKLEQQLVTLAKDLETKISGYETNRTNELNVVRNTIASLSNSITTQRENILSENRKLANAVDSKNTACLKLYGTIPATAKCEIVALPKYFNTSQTDQYIYYPIGNISIKTTNGITTVYINQTHLIGDVRLYRMGNECEGFPGA